MATIRGWMGRAYRILDYDPEIDKFKTLWREEHIKQTDLAVLAGLHETTIKNMFGGTHRQTKRPQHATFAKMAHAMGYEYGLTREREPDYQGELPKARLEKKAHMNALREQREKANGKKTNGKRRGGKR